MQMATKTLPSNAPPAPFTRLRALLIQDSVNCVNLVRNRRLFLNHPATPLAFAAPAP